MKYIISYTKPHNHYIDIEFIAENINSEEAYIQLPAWRPGRYELGNFAKNIQHFAVFDEKGNALPFQKTTKDCWKVNTKNSKQLHIKYNYYGAEINAGSTFLDDTQLYVNPVNCCVYIPNRINEKCELQLLIPNEYKVAIGVESGAEKNNFSFKNFHELADSPFIASDKLQHHKFSCDKTEFNLWFQGECKPEWKKLKNDFEKFCSYQLQLFEKAPFEKYHFLFQILPHKMYHGVEHTTSTVIALGPGYNLMKGDLYENLLGVSCHELFHAWNIKSIRPIEMQPYDYTKENYSKLGYVCEGVTTYYGDYLLLRSGVFDEQQYFKTLEERLQKHIDNFGRYNLSVADSSFDTWLDGYNPGIPNRKTSIYDEGNLLAFITDIFIRKNTNNKNCLDDVMRYLYNEFALKNKGYSDLDYKNIVEHFANQSFDDIFNNYINGTTDYENLLHEAFDYIGCGVDKNPSSKFHEHALGIKVHEVQGFCKVTAVYPNSVADNVGISINDDIFALNNMHIKADNSGTNFTEWCNYFNTQISTITLLRNGIIREIKLNSEPNTFYKSVKIKKQAEATEIQKINFNLWSNTKF